MVDAAVLVVVVVVGRRLRFNVVVASPCCACCCFKMPVDDVTEIDCTKLRVTTIFFSFFPSCLSSQTQTLSKKSAGRPRRPLLPIHHTKSKKIGIGLLLFVFCNGGLKPVFNRKKKSGLVLYFIIP